VGHILIVAVGMITSLIATYYYLRIIKIMWFEQPIKNRFYFQTYFTDSIFAIYIILEFVLVWFIIWSPWIFQCTNFLTATCINPLTSAQQN
jgi:NADH:ubiquinone oxidoreductase subunit 2 (subunit N)